MAGGRPADYTDEIGDRICEELAKGRSLNAICKAEGMPDDSTVYRWILATHNTDLDQFSNILNYKCFGICSDYIKKIQ